MIRLTNIRFIDKGITIGNISTGSEYFPLVQHNQESLGEEHL